MSGAEQSWQTSICTCFPPRSRAGKRERWGKRAQRVLHRNGRLTLGWGDLLVRNLVVISLGLVPEFRAGAASGDVRSLQARAKWLGPSEGVGQRKGTGGTLRRRQTSYIAGKSLSQEATTEKQRKAIQGLL